MSACMKACKQLNLGKGARVVCIMPDSVRNYMSKFLNDSWMVENKVRRSVEACIGAVRTRLHALPSLRQNECACV